MPSWRHGCRAAPRERCAAHLHLQLHIRLVATCRITRRLLGSSAIPAVVHESLSSHKRHHRFLLGAPKAAAAVTAAAKHCTGGARNWQRCLRQDACVYEAVRLNLRTTSRVVIAQQSAPRAPLWQYPGAWKHVQARPGGLQEAETGPSPPNSAVSPLLQAARLS